MAQSQILIVEDEGIVALELRNRLNSMGYQVTGMADSGEKAIKKASQLKPNLILMDIKLKGEIDGIMAAERIRNYLDVPIIYLTAYADEHTLERAKVTEPYGYVLKPFEEHELHIAIEMALYKHGAEAKAKTDEQWLSHTFEQIGDAVIGTDAQGQVNFMNQAAETLTGWSQAEAMGKAVTEIFQVVHETNHAPLENPITKALRENVLGSPEQGTLLVRKDGNALPIDNRAASIRNKAGQIIEAVVVFRDL
ncbi:MAG: response regulator [Caldilineaceae bacterium]